MSDKIQQLAEMESRFNDAIAQLHEQHVLIATLDCRQVNLDAFLVLLSDALRQFRLLEMQRKAVIQSIGAEFSS
jgi:hypothetical protein